MLFEAISLPRPLEQEVLSMAQDPRMLHGPERPGTQIITRGFDPRLSVGSARPAVFRSSTYVFSSPESAERSFAVALGKLQPRQGEELELIYSRLSHPNAEILEDHLTPLEPGAETAAVFNTGMAAISTIFFGLCHPGSAIIYTVPVYGGTHHLLRQVLEPWGVRAVPVAAGDTAALANAITTTKKARLVFIETPANPTLRMSDIAAAARAAKKCDEPPIVVVDNTLLGPIFQHPLQHGADLVVYSATKYLAGFSDMLGGVVMGRDGTLLDPLRGTRAILGNILQPDESWLLDSRLATVSLRMDRQSRNAKHIVDLLVKHESIERIHYPSLFSEGEQKRIFTDQCEHAGAIFSIEIKGGKGAAFEFLRRLNLAKNAVSLGGMESLACHPASTTHSEMTTEELEQAGVTENMVRVSVGIEDWRDLARDFEEALDCC